MDRDLSLYRANRHRLLDVLAREDAACVLPTAVHKVRNHDSEYRFRPDSDFFWATGFREPDAWLVLLPRAEGGDEPRSILFLRERDAAQEVWTGRRVGVERAPDVLGVDEARPVEDLWDDLPELLAGYERIVWRAGLDPERDRRMMGVLAALRGRARAGVASPAALVDTAPILHELRLVKQPGELELMRRAAAITREAHVAAMAAAAPGVGENEIDALLDYTFRRRGGTGQAYTNIVAGGANACILHYVENDQPLRDGDLLLIDAGCEVDYYASDVTRTFPVGGTFSAEQRAVYEAVLAAQLAAIEAVKPGATFESIHLRALDVLAAGLVDLGLVEGPPEKAIEDGTYKRYFMHRTGHWLGLDVHDCGAYARDGASRVLEPGMVLTVEPGLYVAADDDSVEARWRGIGVRIEDDVLVTETGHEVLTAGIPKAVDEVEAACRGEVLQPVS